MKIPPPSPVERAVKKWRSCLDVSAAFTLVEMLVVMAIIVVILGISGPVLSGIGGAGDVSKSVYDIAGLLEQARAYAMSSNTYVYVGLQEADINQSESARQTDGVGRVNVAVYARKDGTRGYDPITVNEQAWNTAYGTGSNFLNIGKLQRFNNIHLADLVGNQLPTSGNMFRPPLSSDSTQIGRYNLASMDAETVTKFEYPLGKAIGNGTCTFNKVIQFDPQGVARVQLKNYSNGDTIAKWMEIGLQQSHGSAAPSPANPATTGPIAAIQIDCMAGTTRIYRP